VLSRNGRAAADIAEAAERKADEERELLMMRRAVFRTFQPRHSTQGPHVLAGMTVRTACAEAAAELATYAAALGTAATHAARAPDGKTVRSRTLAEEVAAALSAADGFQRLASALFDADRRIAELRRIMLAIDGLQSVGGFDRLMELVCLPSELATYRRRQAAEARRHAVSCRRAAEDYRRRVAALDTRPTPHPQAAALRRRWSERAAVFEQRAAGYAAEAERFERQQAQGAAR
jgi:hypothetical protein